MDGTLFWMVYLCERNNGMFGIFDACDLKWGEIWATKLIGKRDVRDCGWNKFGRYVNRYE